MKKFMVYLDDEAYDDLRALAFRKRTTMAALVRHALDKTFEDELDAIAGERALDEAVKDGKGSISWEAYKAKRRRALQAAG